MKALKVLGKILLVLAIIAAIYCVFAYVLPIVFAGVSTVAMIIGAVLFFLLIACFFG